MISSIFLLLALGQSPADSAKFISPSEVIATCSQLEGKGEYEMAIDLYLTISESDTSYIEIQSNLMATYNTLEWYDKSIAIGSKLKDKLSEFRKSIYINLGNAYLNKGDIDKAKEIYSEGLGLFPYNYILVFNMGFAYYKTNDYKKAAEYFQKSARINPFYSSNHAMLGSISMLQGHITKALLSYLTYLAIKPNSNGTLVFLNNLVNDAVRQEGSINPFTDNSYFKNYDDLIRSKAALDSRFHQKVNLNANVVKQSELVLSMLQFTKNSNDFWMDFYVPFYTSLEKSQLSPAFIYFIIKSSKNEDVLKWIEKHSEEKSEWVDMANSILKKNRESNVVNTFSEDKKISHWYFNNNNLSAIGNELNDETKTGQWLFYSNNSQLNAEGEYNSKGEKIGKWIYYHDNGQPSREEYFNADGIRTKPAIYYHSNGALSIIANYNENNKLDGFLEYYYNCGQLREKMPYVNGEQVGKGQIYYKTGELKTTYELRESELENDYISYFKNGQIESHNIYLSGQLNGIYKSFYIDGKPNEIGTYTKDSIDGNWIGYYPNGKLSYEGAFINGSKSGKWTNYHNNGKVSDIKNYNSEGKLQGELKYFNKIGLITNTETYNNDKLVAYKFLDSNGNVLYKNSNEEGNMEYKSYFFTGQLRAEGILKNGKLNGTYKQYFKNGNLNQSGTMQDNNYDGNYLEYYSTGQLYVKCEYSNGLLNGYYKQYFKNALINTEGWYVNGNPEQLWKVYEPDGSLSEEQYFISGNLNGKNIEYSAEGKIHRITYYEIDVANRITQYDSSGNVYYVSDIKYGNGLRVYKTISGDTLMAVNTQCGEFVSDINRYYDNGQTEVHFDLKNSLYDGRYNAFRRNGTLESQGNYLNNKKHGQWKWFHSNGKLESEYYYERGSLEKELTHHYYNGQLESKATYRDGKPIFRKYYDQFGNLQLIKLYSKEDGLTGYVNIQTKDTIAFNNIGEFTLKSYFPNGKLAVTQHFLDGKYQGVSTFYNSNGTIIKNTEFKRGDYDGKMVEYYSNGNAYREFLYKDDLKNGVQKEYFENGKIRLLSPYKNDKINGTQISYDSNGSVKLKIFYWNGYIY